MDLECSTQNPEKVTVSKDIFASKNFPSSSSESSFGSTESVGSGHSDTCCSSISRCGTPANELHESDSCLSDSATPINDPIKDIDALDADQLALRLYLHAALSGDETLPKWDGLANALRVYFKNSWHRDEYTLEECEKEKEFLFWNAVANEKWRLKGH
jgi:hypothetical protein